MIKDIKIIELKTHNDNRGFFREILRLDNSELDFNLGQLSHSKVNQGVLKAWHGHKKQTQWNYLINGKIQVVLYDYRDTSKSFNKYKEFIIEAKKKSLAYCFPPGILHSYRCLEGPIDIIYLTSGTYDTLEEIRISPSDESIIYKW